MNSSSLKNSVYSPAKYLASFIRRSRALSVAKQANLAQVLGEFLIDITDAGKIAVLMDKGSKINLEIGFGSGEHLATRALEKQDQIFIGCEVYQLGIAKLATMIQKEQINNILIYDNDARLLLDKLTNNCLYYVYILFPDPWHKSKHNKRRLINSETLALIQEKLCIGQGKLTIATDCNKYALAIFKSFCQNGWSILNLDTKQTGDFFNMSKDYSHQHHLLKFLIKPKDWICTKYEHKAQQNGKQIYYFIASPSAGK